MSAIDRELPHDHQFIFIAKEIPDDDDESLHDF